MNKIKRFSWIIPLFIIAIIAGIFQLVNKSEGKIEISEDDSKEIIVTISPIDLTTLAEGDSLRKAFKFIDAIEVYRNKLADEGVDQAIKAEAEYNIGLCNTWLGNFDEAKVIF